ncbi:acetyl-CoA hydrolase/transferase family protein [Micromonospora auratinigra]|uniref:Acyl-CoA hydrolase n=1 Tax=Micromonospora auratinigra TaxID=261654 RepID=A0A1A8Z8Y9_9ACTN|nr:acetyl-CoA hydrolase/transferase C-terminal domain-containing protein [Micromonospora auratinigra]SBT40326.1 Acyl-CoA hydrolase [Micromonospora auratinigra]
MRVVSESGLAAALGRLPGMPRVVASGNQVPPRRALAVLDAVLPEYRLHMLNAPPGIPDRPGVHYETSFVGAGMRGHPRLSYVPSRLSLVPALLRGRLAPDVVLLHTTVPRGGAVSLGVEVNVLPAAVEAVRARGGLVVAQANRQMPWTYGDAELPLDAVDLVLEVDERLPAAPAGTPDPVAAAIGARVAALVPDGATLQTGIGGIPDATLSALADRRDLRVFSEMFSDGVLALEKAGCLDPDRPVTASFCFGSDELYDWVDGNERVRMLRTERTNDPATIARQPGLVSVNSALEVDLFAQANASRIGTRVHSGFGGQTDFIVGALHSPGGQAVIALRSWHPRADVSTVVPLLSGPVTSFQHSAIVTEQGCAAVWGRDALEQAQQLVDHAAHPDARESLRAAGRDLGLALR